MTILKRGDMSISRFAAAVLFVGVSSALLVCSSAAQTSLAHTASDQMVLTGESSGGDPDLADQNKSVKLEHFDPNMVDKTLDPCNDFYKYSCSKWLTANP